LEHANKDISHLQADLGIFQHHSHLRK
jgi:hypothetical protein